MKGIDLILLFGDLIASMGVEPLWFLRRISAPPLRSARTAAVQRVRTARCSGVTPLLSTAFVSAPAPMR